MSAFLFRRRDCRRPLALRLPLSEKKKTRNLTHRLAKLLGLLGGQRPFHAQHLARLVDLEGDLVRRVLDPVPPQDLPEVFGRGHDLLGPAKGQGVEVEGELGLDGGELVDFQGDGVSLFCGVGFWVVNCVEWGCEREG